MLKSVFIVFALITWVASPAQNVGIGTNNPTASLDVRRTSNTTMNVYGSEWASHFSFGTNEHTYIRGGKAGSHVILNDFNGAGNVGIGTGAPSQPLSFKTEWGGKISLYTTGIAHYGIGIQWQLLQFYTPTQADDIVFGWGSSEAFNETVRITGDKRVGIGTNNPTASLDVERTSNTTTMNIHGSERISYFNFGTGENIYLRGGKQGAHIILNDLTNSGNVGIGTGNPSAILDIARDPATTAEATLNIHGSGSETISHFYYGNDEHTYIRGGKAGSSVFLNDFPGAGNVQIGFFISDAPDFKLNVAGKIRCTDLEEISDARFKEDIRPLVGVLPSLLSLSGYRYKLKTDSLVRKDQIGLLAQELKGVFPELVSTDNDGMMSVRYTGLVPVLLEGLKEQQQEINELKKLVNKLLADKAGDR